jgi:nucleotide-binding universal stress UspA family protein
MFKKILVPLDGSKMAERILPHVEKMVKFCRGEVTLLQVVISYKIDPREVREEKKKLIEQAQAYLEGVARKWRGRNLRVQTEVAYGKDSVQICDYARRKGFDLIAMATHGKTGLKRLALGSVADQVLHCSRVPVMLYRVA